MELGAVQVVAELVNRIFDSEKYEEFPLSLVEKFILLVLEVFCEIEADQESNLQAGGGLRTWFIRVVFDTFDESSGRLRPCDPVLAPRASASEIELDAIIGGGLLLDPSCFMSSLEFVYVSLGFRELDSSRDFCVAFDRGEMSLLLRNIHREVEISGAPGDSQWLDRFHGVGSNHHKRDVGFVVLEQYISFIISRRRLHPLSSRMKHLLLMSKEFKEFLLDKLGLC
ncbi:hypothetical protein DY000_02006557 [Brassica cretica]|uniref:Uncharacterized protein n=1 Tax=Brassica cretica TaxID=69181 RepID=A0ABQ7CIQ8_BRACR|nr:hypothetical protein DY000_02006557 [Brassica cretica]